jgi:hypothetical protein
MRKEEGEEEGKAKRRGTRGEDEACCVVFVRLVLLMREGE